MRVEDIGEFDLIDVLIEAIERRGLDRAGPEGHLLTIGAGDDAAAWERPAGVEVLTNDVMVEASTSTSPPSAGETSAGSASPST